MVHLPPICVHWGRVSDGRHSARTSQRIERASLARLHRRAETRGRVPRHDEHVRQRRHARARDLRAEADKVHHDNAARDVYEEAQRTQEARTLRSRDGRDDGHLP